MAFFTVDLLLLTEWINHDGSLSNQISYPWHWNLSSDNKAKMACLLLLISLINLQNVVLAQDPDLTINGGWSPWSTVATPCMRPNARGRLEEVFCGGGMKTRKRSCTNPVPQVSLLTNTSEKAWNHLAMATSGLLQPLKTVFFLKTSFQMISPYGTKMIISFFFHIVASISVEWKRVVKRFLINWMQWEIYRVVFGAIPLIVSHKMHYLVLWLRTIGANWNNKKGAFTLCTCHINSYHEGFCAILSPILNAPEPLLQHSTRTLQAHLGLLFS